MARPGICSRPLVVIGRHVSKEPVRPGPGAGVPPSSLPTAMQAATFTSAISGICPMDIDDARSNRPASDEAQGLQTCGQLCDRAHDTRGRVDRVVVREDEASKLTP
jgi:hypothetical protein